MTNESDIGKLIGVEGVVRLGAAEEADLDDFGVEAGREDRTEALHHLRRELDVVDLSGLLVAEVRMRGQVRAIAGGLALVVDLADQAAADERFEAVIDRGQGEDGHRFTGPVKDLIHGGVVALGEEDRKDDFELRGELLAPLAEGLLEVLSIVFVETLNHSNRLKS